MPLAFSNASGPLFVPDGKLISKGLLASRQSPRRRMIFPIHRTQNAGIQRMLNFLQPGTYIRPHRHPRPHAIETMIVLQGRLAFFMFDDAGAVISGATLDPGTAGSVIDIEPNLWHCCCALADDTIIVEIKVGPYDARVDKEFASWAPEESTPEALIYLRGLCSGALPVRHSLGKGG